MRPIVPEIGSVAVTVVFQGYVAWSRLYVAGARYVTELATLQGADARRTGQRRSSRPSIGTWCDQNPGVRPDEEREPHGP